MTETTVRTLDSLDLDLLDRVSLQCGAANQMDGSLCIMQLAWAMVHKPVKGDGVPDNLDCVDSGINKIHIRLNDMQWITDEQRNQLRPTGLRQLSTRDDGYVQARAFLAADYAVRKFAPMALRARAKVQRIRKREEYAVKLEVHAGILENIDPIVDRKTALTGHAAADAAADAADAADTATAAYAAADAAADAADAAADAADAATAAYAAADAAAAADATAADATAAYAAAAYAAAYAADAAYAAAYAADAAYARQQVWTISLELLDAMCSLGEEAPHRAEIKRYCDSRWPKEEV